MKYIFSIIALMALFALNPAEAKAQNYADSVHYADDIIQLHLTQECAFRLGGIVKERANQEKLSDTYTMINAIRPFMGSGQNPDSVFTVNIQAKYVLWMLEGLMMRHTVLHSASDYNKIVLGNPAIPGYTSLTAQIVSKSNATTGSQRFPARYIRDNYIKYTTSTDLQKQRDREALLNEFTF